MQKTTKKAKTSGASNLVLQIKEPDGSWRDVTTKGTQTDLDRYLEPLAEVANASKNPGARTPYRVVQITEEFTLADKAK